MVRTGLEVILDEGRPSLEGPRLGLVCNQASTDSRFNFTKDILFHDRRFNLNSLLTPQHGYFFAQWDNMDETEDAVDPETGLTIHSLYGESREPSADCLAETDVLVFDIQDVGTRVYTYIWTLYLAMQACAKSGTRLVVLDRPNPIDGRTMEGAVLDPGFATFAGLHPIPMRHGMTVGELAGMFNNEAGIGCELEVVLMQGWQRSMYFDETGLPWPFPSTGLPTLESAVAYAGMVVFEGTNISEGRGTTRPFELVGAPFVEPYSLARRVGARRLPGVIPQPYFFKPTVNKFGGTVCGGLKLNVTDRTAFQPFVTALTVLDEIKRAAPSEFAWQPPPYEYEFEKLPFDIIVGTDVIREDLDAGCDPERLRQHGAAGVAEFADRRGTFLLY
jgi:uncharacterized protein YbbC (DUF1343 family)